MNRSSTKVAAHPKTAAKRAFRRAILEAAEHVFAEKGFQGARLADIAARAQIAVGSLYNHLGQKEDILAELIEEHALEFHHELEPRAGDPKDWEDQLRVRVRRLFKYVAAHRGFFIFIADNGLFAAEQPILQGRRVRNLEKVRKTLRDLVTEGLLLGGLSADHDEQRLARVFGGIMKAFVLTSVDMARDADAAVDLFLYGARARK